MCTVLGRGYEYATAREWALKLKELARVVADPYSAADFRHGPLALVERGYPVLAVATTTSLNILGQARPGHQVRFRRQTLAQAVAGQRMQAAAINSLARRTTSLFPHLSEASRARH